MGRLAAISVLIITAATSTFARQAPILLEPAEVVDMHQTIFSSGGTVELRDSYGDVNIVGWEQPQIEVTVTKSTERRFSPEDIDRAIAELDRIVVSTDHVGTNHVVIRTEFPLHSAFGKKGRGKSKVNMQYTIRVPRNTRIIVRHDTGEVHVQDVSGSMDVTSHAGGVRLELPESEQFIVDAHSNTGAIVKDWCYSNPTAEPAHHISIRVGMGDISVRRARVDVTGDMVHG